MVNDSVVTTLADVVPPPAPALADVTAAALVAATLLALASLVVLLARRRRVGATVAPAALALAQLARVQSRWRSGELDSRQAAYHLAAVLRLGLQVNHLPECCPPPLRDHGEHWSSTIRTLARLRYTPASGDADLETLFQRVAQWLDDWRRTTGAR